MLPLPMLGALTDRAAQGDGEPAAMRIGAVLGRGPKHAWRDMALKLGQADPSAGAGAVARMTA